LNPSKQITIEEAINIDSLKILTLIIFGNAQLKYKIRMEGKNKHGIISYILLPFYPKGLEKSTFLIIHLSLSNILSYF